MSTKSNFDFEQCEIGFISSNKHFSVTKFSANLFLLQTDTLIHCQFFFWSVSILNSNFETFDFVVLHLILFGTGCIMFSCFEKLIKFAHNLRDVVVCAPPQSYMQIWIAVLVRYNLYSILCEISLFFTFQK